MISKTIFRIRNLLNTDVYQILHLKRQLENEFLDGSWGWKSKLKFRIKACLVLEKPTILIQSLEHIYVNLFREIAILSEYEREGKLKVSIQPFAKPYKYNWFEKFEIYSEKLENHNAYLVLQGSYADGTETNYSDVDVVVIGDILNKSVIEIVKKIDVLLLQIDPLQHHGVIFIDIRNLGNYWQVDLPLIVFDSAMVFTKNPVEFEVERVISDNVSAPKLAVNFLLALDRYLKGYYSIQGEIGLWRWKFILSQLMLMPTLVLNTKGIYESKAKSFGECRKLYSANAWECIELATEIREEWPENYAKDLYANYRISTRDNPDQDTQTGEHFKNISKYNDPVFRDSVRKFINETKNII